MDSILCPPHPRHKLLWIHTPSAFLCLFSPSSCLHKPCLSCSPSLSLSLSLSGLRAKSCCIHLPLVLAQCVCMCVCVSVFVVWTWPFTLLIHHRFRFRALVALDRSERQLGWWAVLSGLRLDYSALNMCHSITLWLCNILLSQEVCGLLQTEGERERVWM